MEFVAAAVVVVFADCWSTAAYSVCAVVFRSRPLRVFQRFAPSLIGTIVTSGQLLGGPAPSVGTHLSGGGIPVVIDGGAQDQYGS